MIFKSQTPWPWRLLRILVISAVVAWFLMPKTEAPESIDNPQTRVITPSSTPDD